MKEEIKKQGIDPVKYIEEQLSGVKLNSDQKELLKNCINEESFQENFKKLLESLKSSHSGNYRALKKIESIAPLYDAHDFWDSQPVPKAYESVQEDMLNKPIDVDKQVADIKDAPLNLPAGFYWADVDIKN